MGVWATRSVPPALSPSTLYHVQEQVGATTWSCGQAEAGAWSELAWQWRGGSGCSLGWVCPRGAGATGDRCALAERGNSPSGTRSHPTARPSLVVRVPRSVCGFSCDRIPWSQGKGEAPRVPVWAAFSASRPALPSRRVAGASDCCAPQLGSSLPSKASPPRQTPEKAPRAQCLPWRGRLLTQGSL